VTGDVVVSERQQRSGNRVHNQKGLRAQTQSAVGPPGDNHVTVDYTGPSRRASNQPACTPGILPPETEDDPGPEPELVEHRALAVIEQSAIRDPDRRARGAGKALKA
jgi:hypothetical protein